LSLFFTRQSGLSSMFRYGLIIVDIQYAWVFILFTIFVIHTCFHSDSPWLIQVLPSYLDLHLEIDSEGRLRTKLYDKRDDFNFPIVNFPFICSNIPAAPTYGVYISQLIRYSRACGSYQDFLDRRLLLTRKLLNQGFLLVKLKSSFRKFAVATMTWLTAMEYLCHKWPRICSTCRKQFLVLSSFMTYHRVCN
jgi:hypothetical protein